MEASPAINRNINIEGSVWTGARRKKGKKNKEKLTLSEQTNNYS